MKTSRLWGFERITLSPLYFNSTRLRYALSALAGIKGKVLEEGGGAGAFTRAILSYRNDLEIICTDYDPKLINFARKIDKENKFMVADIEKLPFKPQTFNGALSFDVIEHLDNPQKAVDETYRVLKKGGVVHYAIPLEGSLFTIHGLAGKLGFKPKEKYGGHLNHFTASQIQKSLRQGGFKNIETKYSGHLIYQLVDFVYFSFLSIIGKKPDHTVEGFIEELPQGVEKILLITVRIILSFLFYTESLILQNIPGQIGHFTATK